MTSLLPDPEGILCRAARHRFRSMMDGKDAYEQIRIEPAHAIVGAIYMMYSRQLPWGILISYRK